MLQVNELNLFFGKIIEHLRPNKAFENYYPQLQSIVEKTVAHTQDFESLLSVVMLLALVLYFSLHIHAMRCLFSGVLKYRRIFAG